MKLLFLRGTCDNGRTCPNINLTDRGTLVVQGYTVAGIGTAGPVDLGNLTPAAVEVPLSLLPELARETTSWPWLHRTDHDTVLIHGATVTDRDALEELALPAGESAVEIPLTALPDLEMMRHA